MINITSKIALFCQLLTRFRHITGSFYLCLYEHQSEKPAAYCLLRLIARNYFYFVQGKYYENILSRFWESKLVFNCMFLAIYCHSPTFAVNDISKFLNTCFTFDFISYLTKTPSISLHQSCTSIFEEATVFWGGHRFFRGPPVAWGGHRCPDGKIYPYIYMYIYKISFFYQWWTQRCRRFLKLLYVEENCIATADLTT